MAKFKLGDAVKNERGGRGVVRAVFVNREGVRMYAVEKDGSFDFVDEPRLSLEEITELAA